jgi:flagellar protein FlbT
MALKLSLRPGERFVLNGAIIQNGDRRGTLVLESKASVLREKDIMQPEDATSPARRLYLPIMKMCLEEAAAFHHRDEFELRKAELITALRDPEVTARCAAIASQIAEKDYYRALMGCRKLIDYEDERLAYPAEEAPELRAVS